MQICLQNYLHSVTRAFRLFWFGEAVSLLGTATTATLLPLLAATELGAGPAWMGALAAAAWLPWLILGLPAGAVVDRLPPRPVMISADVVGAAAAVSVPLAAWVGAVTLGHLLGVAFAIGCATVFFRAALPRLVVRVVPTDELGRANSRIYATEAGSHVVGPGLAGLLAHAVTATVGLLLDGLSFLVSAVCLWRVDSTPRPKEPMVGSDDVARRIGEGLRVVANDRFLRFSAPVAAIQNFGLVGLLSLQVLFLVDTLRASPAVTGAVLAMGGAGGVVGALIGPRLASRLGNSRASVLLQLASSGCLLIPLATPDGGIALMVVGLLCAEVPIVADNVIRVTWRMAYLPEHLHARVSTTLQMLAFAAMPLAGITAGWLGQALGVRAAIAVMLSVHVAAALSFPFSHCGRQRVRPATCVARQPIEEPA